MSSPDQPAPAVTLRAASLSYRGVVLFEGLDVALPGGRTTCLLGPSGIGKTSLLRLIAGLAAEDGARAEAAAVDETGAPVARRLAYMAQQDLLLPWLSLIDNVTIGFRLRGYGLSGALDRGRGLLDRVGLGDKTDMLPAACSGGMRQRAALARTLLEDRPIVLMDEPFSALDAITRIRLQELAAELLGERTVLLVTHDPLEALRLGHDVVVMAGAPAQIDEPLRLRGDPPRDPGDPEVMSRQAELLRRLSAAGGVQ